MKKVVVVLGAGASHECETDAAPFEERFRPPLTFELFSCFDKPEFFKILKDNPGAAKLAHGLAEKSKFGILDMEEELRILSSHRRTHVQRQFQDIPCYLSRLMRQISSGFTGLAGGYYQLIHRLLADTDHEVAFVNLNYDFLFEGALEAFDSSFNFNNIGQYCHADNPVKVIKPHGSSDWEVDFSGINSQIHWESGKLLDFPPKPWRIEVSRHIQNFGNGGRINRYPVITAPMASKTEDDFVCPPEHMDALAAHCRESSKVLVIGSSFVDQDIFGFLETHLPSDVKVQSVGKSPVGALKPWLPNLLIFFPHAEGGIGSVNDPSPHYREGFRSYLHSSEFREFLEW